MYTLGKCPQCNAQIAVQDVSGRWNSFKPNYAEANLIYEDGHDLRTTICKDCLEHPDFDKLIESITAKGSQAATQKTLDRIKDRGLPVSIARVK